VGDLLLWRCPVKSGVAFALGLVTIMALASYSLVSVVAYVGLTLVTLAALLKAAHLVVGKLGSDPTGGKIEQIR